MGEQGGGLVVDANRTHSNASNKMAEYSFLLALCLLLPLFFSSRAIEKVQYNITEHIVPSQALKSPSFVHFYPLERGLFPFFEELMKWHEWGPILFLF